METNLKIYIDNTREIYEETLKLAKAIAKRNKQNKPVTVEHLANCSIMKNIIRLGVNICKKYGEELPTKEECQKVAEMNARYIIEELSTDF